MCVCGISFIHFVEFDTYMGVGERFELCQHIYSLVLGLPCQVNVSVNFCGIVICHLGSNLGQSRVELRVTLHMLVNASVIPRSIAVRIRDVTLRSIMVYTTFV